tara:strand:+ start:278 stop:571 length:294 start_codon:yes stop_codon:yes gene_type:complete
MTLTWTTEEKQLLKCNIFAQGINPKELNNAELPTDIHLVEYTVGETLYVDSVRAYKAVDIFDAYFDKLAGTGEILSITNGYGNIKPKLFNGVAPADA